MEFFRAEAQCEETLRQQSHQHNCLDSEVSNILFDLEREIAENFYLRHT